MSEGRVGIVLLHGLGQGPESRNAVRALLPANLGAARQLASGIGGAELRIVPGVGHEWNVRQPERFAAELERFLAARR
ncbi:alpha/beta fold hydrolase [Arenivirga flava]|uniref:Uncharacterized protein n=1 Tax=Arenivirga flava TaxID=1930060 RepID=A0AA37UCT6_9MICO|nr:hypothetical protein [Arenivirga flava]GMA26974.1 hypothetical protein GCM10025874_02270 [Arenivirga flava]